MAINANMDLKDRTRTFRVIGWLLLAAGVAFGLIAPLEMQCFTYFSEGGKFHYEGFGYGSLLFGIIAAQIVGYMMMAAALIPMGYGHIRMRRWVQKLSLAFLYVWLIIGLPVILICMFILAGTKELTLTGFVIIAVIFFIAYLILPLWLMRFYKSKNALETLKAKDMRTYRTDSIPLTVLVLYMLCVFHIAENFVFILYNGIFPVFGSFLTGVPGTVALDIVMACLVFIIWGLLGLRPWAWRAAFLLFFLLTVSAAVSFAGHSYSELLMILAFPPSEIKFIGNMPL